MLSGVLGLGNKYTTICSDCRKKHTLLELAGREVTEVTTQLSYRRDITFKEDRCRLRTGQAARTMATLNNLVLALILQQGYTNVTSAGRKFAAKPLQALKLIFQQP